MFFLVAFVGKLGVGKLLGHVVEHTCEFAQFVLAVYGDAAAEIVVGNGARAVRQSEDGFYKAVGEIKCGGKR